MRNRMSNTLTLRRPDDWHLHLRDGAMLRAVLPETTRHFARAIVMPNLVPPVVTGQDAAAYRARIMAAMPEGADFTPLMTLYLTEETDPEDVAAAHASGLVSAVKLYPAGATTNSASGVRDFDKVRSVLDKMAEIGLPLCVHGEVTDPSVDIFDREAVFIDRVLDPVRRATPGLRVVMEHITTSNGVDYVRAHDRDLGATITTALLLPARGQARRAPPCPARRRHLWRCAVLLGHRQRAAYRPAQGERLRLRGMLYRDQHDVDPRACIRGRGRT
jgi:dihydroorotase